jgi:hypothetical protein
MLNGPDKEPEENDDQQEEHDGDTGSKGIVISYQPLSSLLMQMFMQDSGHDPENKKQGVSTSQGNICCTQLHDPSLILSIKIMLRQRQDMKKVMIVQITVGPAAQVCHALLRS